MKKLILALMLLGTVGYSAARITNTDIASSAAIALNKLAASTANRVPLFDASGFLTASSVTNTTLGYLDATSSIQTQIDGKQPLDADLTSLAAAASTDALYYRSAANTWSPVTLDASITLTAGTLAASGSGGGGDSDDDNNIYVDAPSGHGATNTTVRLYSAVRRNVGLVTYASSANEGSSFTVAAGGAGAWKMCAVEYRAGTAPKVGITVNGASLATSIATVTRANGRRAYASPSSSTTSAVACTIEKLADADVVRVQTTGNEDDTSARSSFWMTRLGASSGHALLHTGNGHGGTNTNIRRFSTTASSGSNLTINQSAGNGDNVTTGAEKLYGICIGDGSTSGGADTGISISTSSIGTAIFTLTIAQGKVLYYNHADTGLVTGCFTKRLPNGAIIRLHDDGAADDTSDASFLSVVEIDGSEDAHAYVHTGSGVASSETKKMLLTTISTLTGTAISAWNSAISGTTFMVNEPGVFDHCFNTFVTGATSPLGTIIEGFLPTVNVTTPLEYFHGARSIATGGGANEGRVTCYAQYYPRGTRISFQNDGGTPRNADVTSAYITKTQ